MRKLKVVLWARSERDADYLKHLLQGGKGVVVCELGEKVNALVVDAKLLTCAEGEVLGAIARYGSVRKVAQRTSRSDGQKASSFCPPEVPSPHDRPSRCLCPSLPPY